MRPKSQHRLAVLKVLENDLKLYVGNLIYKNDFQFHIKTLFNPVWHFIAIGHNNLKLVVLLNGIFVELDFSNYNMTNGKYIFLIDMLVSEINNYISYTYC